MTSSLAKIRARPRIGRLPALALALAMVVVTQRPRLRLMLRPQWPERTVKWYKAKRGLRAPFALLTYPD